MIHDCSSSHINWLQDSEWCCAHSQSDALVEDQAEVHCQHVRLLFHWTIGSGAEAGLHLHGQDKTVAAH